MRSGVDHTVLPANHITPAFTRSSPWGATTEWTVIALSWWSLLLIYRPREEAELPLLADLQQTVYPYKWLPSSCRSGADQWKFADQRPTFYHWATQPTAAIYILLQCKTTMHMGVRNMPKVYTRQRPGWEPRICDMLVRRPTSKPPSHRVNLSTQQ